MELQTSKDYRKKGLILGCIMHFTDGDIFIPFECQRCGKCCKIGAQWGPFDLKRVSKYLGYSDSVEGLASFINKYLGDAGEKTYKLYKGDKCPFLLNTEKWKNHCTIYGARPYGCKMFPILTDFRPLLGECFGYDKYQRIHKRLRRSPKFLWSEPVEFRVVETSVFSIDQLPEEMIFVEGLEV